jgi:hypothetical protein
MPENNRVGKKKVLDTEVSSAHNSPVEGRKGIQSVSEEHDFEPKSVSLEALQARFEGGVLGTGDGIGTFNSSTGKVAPFTSAQVDEHFLVKKVLGRTFPNEPRL